MDSLRTADGIELIRVVAQRALQELIETKTTTRIGAEPGERTEARTTWSNRHRNETLTTQAGDLELAIPKARTGSFFPSLLKRRAAPIRPCARAGPHLGGPGCVPAGAHHVREHEQARGSARPSASRRWQPAGRRPVGRGRTRPDGR
ncbi:transposase [Saccharothrix sp. ST-888]|uniref:transposase n=1 Tax=Saccharothrix sp. ST-888 TaxID=1427391 RepID=UPI000A45D7CF